MKNFKIDGYYLKLWLYITAASLTALLSDLQHYVCHTAGELHLSKGQLFIVVINFVLQGVIASRAYLDDSSEKLKKESEDPQILCENSKQTNH